MDYLKSTIFQPDIQDRIRAEIKEALLANDGQLTYEAVVGMEYLGMVISEVLRLYPPLPFLDRECTAAEDEGGSYSMMPESHYHIPKGMPVVIPIYALHRDPQVYRAYIKHMSSISIILLIYSPTVFPQSVAIRSGALCVAAT